MNSENPHNRGYAEKKQKRVKNVRRVKSEKSTLTERWRQLLPVNALTHKSLY